jgi:hypothetical protein
MALKPKSEWVKTPSWLAPVAMGLLALAIACGSYCYLERRGVWGKGEMPLLIGFSGVMALAVTSAVAALAHKWANAKGLRIPGLERVTLAFTIALACIVIPPLLALAVAQVVVTMVSTFGSLLAFVLYVALFGGHRR